MKMPPTCAYFEQHFNYYRRGPELDVDAAIAELEAELAARRKVAAARQRNDQKLPAIDIDAKASLLESMRLAGIGGKRKKKLN